MKRDKEETCKVGEDWSIAEKIVEIVGGISEMLVVEDTRGKGMKRL